MLFGKEKIKAEPCKVLKKRNMLWLTSVSVLAKKKKARQQWEAILLLLHARSHQQSSAHRFCIPLYVF